MKPRSRVGVRLQLSLGLTKQRFNAGNNVVSAVNVTLPFVTLNLCSFVMVIFLCAVTLKWTLRVLKEEKVPGIRCAGPPEWLIRHWMGCVDCRIYPVKI